MMKLNLIQAWLDNVAYSHSHSKRTPKIYREAIEKFFTFIDSSPEKVLEDYERLDFRMFTKKHGDYLRAFISALYKQGYSPNTIHANVAPVRSFFKYNDLPLGFIPTSKNRVAFHNRDITKEEIIRILNNASPRDRAFYLMMIQSGLRPRTLTDLTYVCLKEDFESGKIPCLINIPREMTKGEFGDHFTFIGEDAVNALKAYFAERGLPKDNERIFNVNAKNVFSVRFGYSVRQLGLMAPSEIRKGKKPQPLRLYCLRKYFRKFAGAGGVDMANFWMGHQTSYGTNISKSDQAYFSKDVEHHRQIYEEKALPGLRIFEPSGWETEQTIKMLQQRIGELERDLEELRTALLPELEEKKERLEGVKIAKRIGERIYEDVKELEGRPPIPASIFAKSDEVDEVTDLKREIEERMENLDRDRQELENKISRLTKLLEKEKL